MNNWTRGPDGQYVNWLAPEYRAPGGQLRLLVAGEDPAVLTLEESIKRIQEYYRLTHRESSARIAAPEQVSLL